MEEPGYFAHPSAFVDEGARVGKGTRIWHFAHVMGGAEIGADCVIGQGCYVANVKIGSGVRIQNNVFIYDSVVLEDDVFCGPSCVFTNVLNPRSAVSRKDEYLPTVVRRGASIGANATIVCGAEIGSYAFVGAGAVVKGDVPAYALVVGVPAHQIGWMCKCGERLPAELAPVCEHCNSKYKEVDGALVPSQ